MQAQFSGHNIRLDSGDVTRPQDSQLLADRPWIAAAKRVLNLVFPNGVAGKRIVDLGCLEGGYAVELARMGFDTLGIEVRETNFRCCEYVLSHLALPNLRFVHDTVWNLGEYGKFDAVFCYGLLYHLDRPRTFLELVAETGAQVLVCNTHYAPEVIPAGNKFGLSEIEINEGLPGRWFSEFTTENEEEVEALRWASWENKASFWLTKRALLQTLQDIGFDLVFEQYDWLHDGILHSMTAGYYTTDQRGQFVGIRSL